MLLCRSFLPRRRRLRRLVDVNLEHFGCHCLGCREVLREDRAERATPDKEVSLLPVVWSGLSGVPEEEEERKSVGLKPRPLKLTLHREQNCLGNEDNT